jgi:hypothetical protein
MEGAFEDFSVGDKDIAIVGSSEGLSEGSFDGVDDVAKLGYPVGEVEECTDGRDEGERG